LERTALIREAFTRDTVLEQVKRELIHSEQLRTAALVGLDSLGFVRRR
jgi:hypothetical protein